MVTTSQIAEPKEQEKNILKNAKIRPKLKIKFNELLVSAAA
jgi:hypothetical protein